MLDLALVIRKGRFGDDLHVRQRRTIVQFEKAEAPLTVASGADPTLQPHLAAYGRRFARLGNSDGVHTSEFLSRARPRVARSPDD
jgi:hypothetical protein